MDSDYFLAVSCIFMLGMTALKMVNPGMDILLLKINILCEHIPGVAMSRERYSSHGLPW